MMWYVITIRVIILLYLKKWKGDRGSKKIMNDRWYFQNVYKFLAMWKMLKSKKNCKVRADNIMLQHFKTP